MFGMLSGPCLEPSRSLGTRSVVSSPRDPGDADALGARRRRGVANSLADHDPTALALGTREKLGALVRSCRISERIHLRPAKAHRGCRAKTFEGMAAATRVSHSGRCYTIAAVHRFGAEAARQSPTKLSTPTRYKRNCTASAAVCWARRGV